MLQAEQIFAKKRFKKGNKLHCSHTKDYKILGPALMCAKLFLGREFKNRKHITWFGVKFMCIACTVVAITVVEC